MTARSDDTRSKILKAAFDEFAANGLGGARVDKIARAADVNKAMIYYHFPSKRKLFSELFKSEMDQLKKEIAAVLHHRDVGAAADMTRAMQDLLTYAASKKKLLSVLMSESMRPGSRSTHLFQLLDLTTEIGLETGRRAGRQRTAQGDEPLLHELFSGLLPIIEFVLLADRLKAYYGWKDEDLTQRFAAYLVRYHGGY